MRLRDADTGVDELLEDDPGRGGEVDREQAGVSGCGVGAAHLRRRRRRQQRDDRGENERRDEEDLDPTHQKQTGSAPFGADQPPPSPPRTGK